MGERVWRRVSSEHEQPTSGRGGIVGSKVRGRQRPAAEFPRRYLCESSPERRCWWRKVVTDWNRVAIILPPIYATPSFSWSASPTTDAAVSRSSRSGGGGGFFGGLYTHFRFTQRECQHL